MVNQLEDGDIVICTVNKIVGTTVFVFIEGYGEGSIIFSEIAPGRIRNIRAHVVPKKIIVCKVLRVTKNNVDLSLRRVTPKEKKDKLEEAKYEKSYTNILKSIVGEKAKTIILQIEEESTLFEFFQEAKENPSLLEKFLEKSTAEKVLEILNAQKKKKTIVKKEISLKTKHPEGINQIKEILGNLKEIKIKYISAGKYLLELESNDPKKASQILKNILSDLEKTSKKEGFIFSIKEK